MLQCRPRIITGWLPRQQQTNTTNLPLEIRLMGPLQSLDRFVKSPVRPIKRRRSPSSYVQSPIKRRTPAVDTNRFVAPPLRFPQSHPAPNFVAPNNPGAIRVKRRLRRHVRYKRPQNATPPPALQDEDVTDVGGFGDFGGFDSPVKAQDNIDWTITSCDLEKLKLEILPCYWEHLLDSVNSIVRVTQRLYILQDWNYKGHLVV